MHELFFQAFMRGLDLREPSKETLRVVLDKELTGTPFTEEQVLEIHTAFDIAFEGHLLTPPRESGEAYIYHPLRSTIRMVRRQKRFKLFDHKIIMETLTHDCFEEVRKEHDHRKELLMYSSIQMRLGEDIAYDTLCLTKQKDRGETNEEYHARLLRSDSWRVLLVKPEDRLDNVWTISSVPFDKAKRKLQETEVWFTQFKSRGVLLVIREIAKKKLDPRWESYTVSVYDELFRVVRAQKLALDIS